MTLADFMRHVLHIYVEVIIIFLLFRGHRLSDFGHDVRRVYLLLNARVRLQLAGRAYPIVRMAGASLNGEDLCLSLCGRRLLIHCEVVIGEFLERVGDAAVISEVVLHSAAKLLLHHHLIVIRLIGLHVACLVMRLAVSGRGL